MNVEVRKGVVGERRHAAPVAPNAQRDLLGHRSAGHEDRRFFAELGGEAPLETFDDFASAVDVGVECRVDELRQVRERALRANRQMMRQRARTGRAQPCELGVGYRRSPSSLISLR